MIGQGRGILMLLVSSVILTPLYSYYFVAVVYEQIHKLAYAYPYVFGSIPWNRNAQNGKVL